MFVLELPHFHGVVVRGQRCTVQGGRRRWADGGRVRAAQRRSSAPARRVRPDRRPPRGASALSDTVLTGLARRRPSAARNRRSGAPLQRSVTVEELRQTPLDDTERRRTARLAVPAQGRCRDNDQARRNVTFARMATLNPRRDTRSRRRTTILILSGGATSLERCGQARHDRVPKSKGQRRHARSIHAVADVRHGDLWPLGVVESVLPCLCAHSALSWGYPHPSSFTWLALGVQHLLSGRFGPLCSCRRIRLLQQGDYRR